MPSDFDITIVGSGFSGSLLAMIARRLGYSVLLIEKGKHPRFAIGESSTPLANLLLGEIAAKYDLSRIKPLCKWGSWQRSYPKVACGLKRGFTFYHHELGREWKPRANRSNELLVAASPHDEIADTHWYRADFDALFVSEAQRLGAEYIDEAHLSGIDFRGDLVVVRGHRRGQDVRFTSRLIFDATGPRGFLNSVLKLGDALLPGMPATQGLYAHFSAVHRWQDRLNAETPPYPVDDAAVHHVFPGGWIWVLRFNNGTTSAGVAASDDFGLEHGAKAWERLLCRLPSLRDDFADAQPCMPFAYARRLSWKSSRASGERWALLPSAAGFIDPLLSTGFPLALLGVQRLGLLLERGSKAIDFSDYEHQTFSEIDLAARLIGKLYAHMADFKRFVDYSMLYFAAVSFSEAARRLGRAELAQSFLAADHPLFGPMLLRILENKSDDLDAAIELVNVAGLRNPKQRNWYPVRADDLLDNCAKLNVQRDAVQQMLERTGFYQWSTQKCQTTPA